MDASAPGEEWRADTMNYLIDRAPDMESLLQGAECRNRQEDQEPITRRDVDMQVTVGIDPSILEGHL